MEDISMSDFSYTSGAIIYSTKTWSKLPTFMLAYCVYTSVYIYIYFCGRENNRPYMLANYKF